MDFKEVSSMLCRIKKDSMSSNTHTAVCVNHLVESKVLMDFKDSWKIRELGEEILTTDDDIDKFKTWLKNYADEDVEAFPYTGLPDNKIGFINTATFTANWHVPYKETDIKIEPFENIDHVVLETDMFHSIENLYVENENFVGFSKDFVVTSVIYPNAFAGTFMLIPDTTKYSFIALLPKRNEKRFLPGNLKYN